MVRGERWKEGLDLGVFFEQLFFRLGVCMTCLGFFFFGFGSSACFFCMSRLTAAAKKCYFTLRVVEDVQNPYCNGIDQLYLSSTIIYVLRGI